jgi:hypothetical protein
MGELELTADMGKMQAQLEAVEPGAYQVPAG